MFTKNSRKGFTIVELVIVIAIIAILATALIPTFGGLIGSAGRTVDEQLVREINNYLMLEEAINGKPNTVADVQKILTDNGLTPVKANLADNTIYWIGSENRAIIWTADGDTGSVTYPKEYAEKYADYTTPSADWIKLGDSAGTVEHEVVVVTPAEGETVKDALVSALGSAGSDDVVKLPANTTLPANNTDGGFHVINQALVNESGLGKSVTIDMNGSTLECSGVNSAFMKNEDGTWMMDEEGNYVLNILTVPTNGKLTLSNGTINTSGFSSSTANLAAESGGSLILRNMVINSTGAAIFPTGNASEVIIENCTIKTTGGYGVGTNRAQGSNIRIVIRNSTIEANSAVFINTSGEVIIEDSTIIGGVHGLVVRAGSAKVSDTTIKVTDIDVDVFAYNKFDLSEYSSSFDPVDWQTGNGMPAAGIVIGCYANNDSYSGNATVELTNVKIETPDASVLPTVVMAARQGGKIASLTYDAASSVGDVKIYGQDWAGAETTFAHAGTITVNGVEQTLGG